MRTGRVAPEINPHHFLMSEPDRLMMIMIRSTGMTHSSQHRSGGPYHRKEEWARIIRARMPSQHFAIIDLK